MIVEKVGYLKVTGFEAEEVLIGCEQGGTLTKVFKDSRGEASKAGEQLEALKNYVRAGDEVYISSFDQVAGNFEELYGFLDHLVGEGVSVYFGSEKVSFRAGEGGHTSVPDMLKLLEGCVNFEGFLASQSELLEQCFDSRSVGAARGRKPVIDRAKVVELLEKGLSMRKVAKKLGISLSSVQRVKAAL